jgi:hypothetical protein
VPDFDPTKFQAIDKAFERARARLRLTRAKAAPVVELVYAGKFGRDRITDIVVTGFDW